MSASELNMQPEDRSASQTPARTPPQDGKFEDFDDPYYYSHVQKELENPDARNFVVEFGPEHCRIASNLTLLHFEKLLSQKRDPAHPIRWINIWNPSRQDKGVIELIGQHYGFSLRLRTSMKVWDRYKPWLESQKQEMERKLSQQKKNARSKQRIPVPNQDPEMGTDSPPRTVSDTTPPPVPDFLTQNYVKIQDTLNYTTIDQVGEKFLCIGANWLHNRPTENQTNRATKSQTTLVPPKHWAWYALCFDKLSGKPDPDTVITFHEAAYYSVPPSGENTDRWQKDELELIRSNTAKVLLQLSNCGVAAFEKNITQLASVRVHLREVDQSRSGRRTDGGVSRVSTVQFDIPSHKVDELELEGSSNLFYYLFEDYTPTIPILIQSKKKLDSLRAQVLGSSSSKEHFDTSRIVPELYTISKELRELRHLFESYHMLIQRILATPGSPSVPIMSESLMVPSKEVRLAPSARDRFERLGDRLKLLMLNTIHECLEEQKSLSDTYFNLTNQKDSQATARLTRSATMLAKMSVFFLPISFMTSYFSVQIPDLTNGYTGTTYWGAFGVIATVSFLGIFFFGKLLEALSDSLDSLSRSTTDWIGGVYAGIAGRFRSKRKNRPADDDEKGDELGESDD